MDVYSSDKMDAYQWCNISKFSKFYAFLIPYSYINASLLPDHHHLKRKLQHAAAITGYVFSRHQLTLQTKTMCHSMHQAFRYTLINQREFLDNSGEKKKWGKTSSSGKKTLSFKMQVHIMPWEKNLLVIIKQLQSKTYQGQFCQLNPSCPQSRWHWCHDKLHHKNNLSGTGCVPDNYFSLGSALYSVFQKKITQHIKTNLLSFSNQK